MLRKSDGIRRKRKAQHFGRNSGKFDLGERRGRNTNAQEGGPNAETGRRCPACAREGTVIYEQPLSAREKELVHRAYALFDFFYDKLREDHEQMRLARAMRQRRHEEQSATSPSSNTLNSCVDNMIADQTDNMPEAVMVPEREETAASAEEMSDVVSFVLYHAGWPGKYQALMEDAVVTGTGVAQVYWDDDMEEGEGMVNVLAWHPEDFYPDPMYENIQDGRGCFKVTHTTVAWVQEHYPQARGYIGSDPYAMQGEGALLEAPDGDEKTTLIEFWYKRYDARRRRTHVHMAQMAGHALLYSTETGFGTEESGYQDGVYAHGQYPFILYKYRDVWKKPFGTGLIHDYAGTQQASTDMPNTSTTMPERAAYSATLCAGEAASTWKTWPTSAGRSLNGTETTSERWCRPSRHSRSTDRFTR